MAKSLRRYGIVFIYQLLDCQDACFDWNTFRRWKKLDLRGPVPVWFILLVEFIKEGGLLNHVALSYCSALADSPCDFSYVNKHLLNSDLSSVIIYTDSSIKSLGLLDARGGAAAYFLDANVSIGVRVDGLLSLTLVELKDLSVTWNKVKGHSGVVENKCADFYADAAVVSKFFLPLVVLYHFLRVKDRPVSRNACHIAKKLFNTVHSVGWEAKCVGSFVRIDLYDHFDKANTFCVWHPDGKIKSGYTSSALATLQLYLIKALHHCLLVAKRKRLYNPRYLSIACIRCGLVKDSDYVFFCVHDANVQETLLSDASTE
ncbi:hypothetical protein G9A89_004159 [Geosiphon pyriformis]|nr:hypothetical protein G9A89_004159 [Geosiphon pyriformis]